MKVKDITDLCRHSLIELHNGSDGKLVAKSRKTVEIYNEADVMSIYPRISTSKDGGYAQPYLYVFIFSCDVKKIKNKEEI